MKTKLIFISDTHNHHPFISMTPAHIVCHTGDNSNAGKMSEILSFINWYANWPALYKIWVPGNHERSGFSKHVAEIRQLCRDRGIQLLLDEGFTAKLFDHSISFWGAPLLIKGRGYKNLPNYVDVLLTHEPAKGRLDLVTCRPLKAWESPDGHLGHPDLVHVNTKVHACGHIHQSYGCLTDTMPDKRVIHRINSSACDELSHPPKLINKPITLFWEDI